MPQWVLVAYRVLAAALLVPSVLVSLVGTALRLRRAGQPDRQQLSWLILPLATLLVSTFVLGSVWWLAVVAFASVPVAVLVGVLRYNLLGIEVVVRRALVYAGLTAGVALAFAVVTTVLSEVLPVSAVLLKLQVPDRTAAALKARAAGLGTSHPHPHRAP